MNHIRKLNALDFLKLYQFRVAINKSIRAMKWENPLIAEMYRYATIGGHRSRSIAVVLSYNLFRKDWMRAVPAAVALELGHKASIIHDDLVDGDKYRGGKPTFHSIYGSEASVIMGDLLMGTVFEMLDTIAASLKVKLTCYKYFANAYRITAEGELNDIILRNSLTDLDTILKIHYHKTGKLGELALKTGGLLAGVSQEDIESLSKIGKDLGIAFQIINDINNWIGYETKYKRSRMSDIQNDRLSILTGLSYLPRPNSQSSDAALIDNLSSNEVLRQAHSLVEEYCQEARDIIIKKLHPSRSRNILYSLTFQNNILLRLF